MAQRLHLSSGTALHVGRVTRSQTASACSVGRLLPVLLAQHSSGAALYLVTCGPGQGGLTCTAEGLGVWPQAHVPGLFPRCQLDVGALLAVRLRNLPPFQIFCAETWITCGRS